MANTVYMIHVKPSYYYSFLFTRINFQINVVQRSILESKAQVIVNAANSHGLMSGGVAGVIRRAAGFTVEDEAMQQAPIPVGTAVLTSGGKTAFEGIIQALRMYEPAMRIPADERRTGNPRGACKLGDSKAFTSLAIPGMDTGCWRCFSSRCRCTYAEGNSLFLSSSSPKQGYPCRY